jgi:hypothetical protein
MKNLVIITATAAFFVVSYIKAGSIVPHDPMPMLYILAILMIVAVYEVFRPQKDRT